ncbi:MAG: AMP-binding protein [Bdellovibrionales bacterium]|nr:AMP-binding protein [Massilia sp.]
MSTPADHVSGDTLEAVQTLAQLFSWRVRQSPHAVAYLEFNAAAAGWTPVSWQQMALRTERTAQAMQALQLQRGERIAILLPNGLDAVSVDQAALALGCVPVPMHALDNPASIAFILADSDASLLVAQSEAQWLAIAATGTAFPCLRHIVIAADAPLSVAATVERPVTTLAAWLARALTDTPAEREGPKQEDLAALVYTSGTTGKPKGVMLTHDNVLCNIKATLVRVEPVAHDVFLSFLPLSHTFERTAGYYLPIAAGCSVAHARSVALLSDDLQMVRPTILVSVPRIYERAHSKIMEKLGESRWKSSLFEVAHTMGWRRFCRAQHLPAPAGLPAWLDVLLWPVFDKLVGSNVRAQFGGRLRVAVSGGAALSQPIGHCFLGLGLPLLQGYGMTETSPIVAANALDDNDPATVGRTLDGVEVRIGENRELQVRGRSVMRGYWKRDADTAAAFVDGWLRTGDQAAIEDGRVRILGRIKEIIVTSTGEKIAPADLEQAITADPLFEQAYAFGDGHPFIACIVVLSRARWEQMAAELNVNAQSDESLREPRAVALVLERVREQTHEFPYYAQPRAVILSLIAWTPDNTLLTPTLKLKRLNLADHFAWDIERIYQR